MATQAVRASGSAGAGAGLVEGSGDLTPSVGAAARDKSPSIRSQVVVVSGGKSARARRMVMHETE